MSVSNKNNLEPLVHYLHKHNVEIIASGGTGEHIKKLRIPFTPIEDITKNPEVLGGRVKTLSFQIAAALLCRSDLQEDTKDLEKLNIKPIDLVVCNLYPFGEVLEQSLHTDSKNVLPKLALPKLVEHIDIGGPTLIRAAAKNHQFVSVLHDPESYHSFIDSIENNNGHASLELRKELALDAFKYTALYEQTIYNGLQKTLYDCEKEASHEQKHSCEQKLTLDEFFKNLDGKNTMPLRYGENPHQKAYFTPRSPKNVGNQTTESSSTPHHSFYKKLQGKDLSYNNLLDMDTAYRVITDIHYHFIKKMDSKKYAVAIVKHNNPCGVCVSDTPLTAIEQAWNGDPVSAFGSIIATNHNVTKELALFLKNKFTEVLIAPEFTNDALESLKEKKNLRLIQAPLDLKAIQHPMLRTVVGGCLMQTEDVGHNESLNYVTHGTFSKEEESLAHFGILTTKYLKSNAISVVTYDKNSFYVSGVGTGNPNRVISVAQAIEKSQQNRLSHFQNSVLVSDAFFPFEDSIDLIHQHKIKNIIQPGGSVNDQKVIDACNTKDMIMAFTGTRHFRH